MKRVKSLISVLLMLVMLGSVAGTAMAAQTGEITTTSVDKNLKFKKLYRTDKEFRSNVDKIRTIIVKDKLSDRDWSDIKRLFGEVLEKLDGIRT